MTTIQTNQADAAKALASCVGGDTLQLIGDFQGWRPGKRTFADKRLIVDASQAVLYGLYGGTLDGVEWHGGTIRCGTTYKLGFRMDNAKNFFLGGVTLDDVTLAGNGVQFLGGSNIEIDGVSGSGFLDAIVLARIDTFLIQNFDLSGMAADGVDLYNVANGTCQDGKVHDNNHISAKHPDAVQLANGAGYTQTANVTVQRVAVNSVNMQGITAFNHPEKTPPDQRYQNIIFRDLDITVGMPQACALYGCDGGLIENVNIQTQPGAPFRASLNVGDCTGIERYGNTVAAGAGKPGYSDPPRPAPPPPPFDAKAVIAGIRSGLDALEAGLGI